MMKGWGPFRYSRALWLCVLSLLFSDLSSSLPSSIDVVSAQGGKQSLLGPGLYVFQTRVRDSVCGDAEQDGFVLSYFAAIDGVPGSAAMSMQLANTKHFSDWRLKVTGNAVSGMSRIGTSENAPESSFEAKLEGEKWKGVGARTYNAVIGGKSQRCKVNYDALLKRID